MSPTAGSSPPRRYRVALLGCGMIAGGYDENRTCGGDHGALSHAGAFSTSDHFEIIACADPDASHRKAFQQRWNIANGFDDARSLLEALHPDVVSLCTPTQTHESLLKLCLEYGPRVVFAEKPLTGQPAASRHIIEACESKAIALVVNYIRRFDPSLQALRDDIHAGRYGDLLRAEGVYGKGIGHNGSHMLDLFDWLFGPLRAVSAARPVYDHWPDDPTLDGGLETAHGAPILLNGIDCRRFQIFEATLWFDKAVISLEQGCSLRRIRPVETNPLYPAYRTVVDAPLQPNQQHQAMPRAVAAIAAYLDQGTIPESTGHNALRAEDLAAEMTLMAAAKPSHR